MELILKVGTVAPDQTSYQDGDIISTMSDVQIEYCHAEMICHVDKAGVNSVGLRDINTLFHRYMEKTSKYKFIRLNSNEVERYNLLTDEVDTISTTPNEKGEAMHVAEYLTRRLKHARHKIFGVSHGNEVWYGGNAPRDRDHSDVLWNEIEGHSDHLKANCCSWPFTPIEKRHFLPVNCCGHQYGEVVEISTPTCVQKAEPVYETKEAPEDDVLIAKKKWQVPYWDLDTEFSIDIDDVRNIDKEVDARSTGDQEGWNHMDDIHVDKVAAGIVTL